MRLRNVLIATTTLVAGSIIGATTQHFASADVTSGDRPVLVPIDTCRIADTRAAPDNVGPRSTPLDPAETITVDAQQVGTDCTGQIPATATALSLNVTALNATSNSFLTIWPDGPRPTASALNPAPGDRVFNAVTTELSATQTFEVYNNRGNVDVFIDVNGYYDNHNHDDLYYTEAEVEDAIDDAVDTAVDAARPLIASAQGDQTLSITSPALVPLGGSFYSTVRSVVVDASGPGFIAVNASLSAAHDEEGGEQMRAGCGISTGNNLGAGEQLQFILNDQDRMVVSPSRTLPVVGSGEITINLLCRTYIVDPFPPPGDLGTMVVNNSSLTATFIAS